MGNAVTDEYRAAHKERQDSTVVTAHALGLVIDTKSAEDREERGEVSNVVLYAQSYWGKRGGKRGAHCNTVVKGSHYLGNQKRKGWRQSVRFQRCN